MNLAKLVRQGMNAVPADLKASVTFTKVTTTQAEATGLVETVASTVVGTASRDDGDPERYALLSLVESKAATLIFVPDTAGEEPDLGSTVVFGGVTWTVKAVDPIAPRGVTVAASVIVSR